MLSKKFFAWVGVGVLSAVAIPALAAPHLAKMVQRRPAVTAKATPAKAAIAKPVTGVAKTTAITKPATAVVGKSKMATATPGRVHAIHRAHAATKLHTKNKAGSAVIAKKTTAPSSVTAKSAVKPVALKTTTPKVTTASTAKKLLH